MENSIYVGQVRQYLKSRESGEQRKLKKMKRYNIGTVFSLGAKRKTGKQGQLQLYGNQENQKTYGKKED